MFIYSFSTGSAKYIILSKDSFLPLSCILIGVPFIQLILKSIERVKFIGRA